MMKHNGPEYEIVFWNKQWGEAIRHFGCYRKSICKVQKIDGVYQLVAFKGKEISKVHTANLQPYVALLNEINVPEPPDRSEDWP